MTPGMLYETSENAPFSLLNLQEITSDGLQQYGQPVRQKQYLIFWSQKGRGWLKLDSMRLDLQDNTAYCVSPNQVIQLSLTPEAAGYIIRFSAVFLMVTPNKVNPLYGNLFNHPSIRIQDKVTIELKRIFAGMENEFGSNSPLKTDILREYLKIVLMYLTGESLPAEEQDGLSTRAEIINRFFVLLQENFTEKKQVSEYARMMSISANYLNNIIKKGSGYAASYHIQQQIMKEARRQAIYTNKSMKEIAYDLGFEEYTHFSKFFKKLEGMPFSIFRKNHSGQASHITLL
ncbi:MAG TPA: helix-turn-helix domain-containing protein [Niastella sp.]